MRDRSDSRLVSALLRLVNSLKAGRPLHHSSSPERKQFTLIFMSRFRGYNSVKSLLSFRYNLNYFLVALKNMNEV